MPFKTLQAPWVGYPTALQLLTTTGPVNGDGGLVLSEDIVNGLVDLALCTTLQILALDGVGEVDTCTELIR